MGAFICNHLWVKVGLIGETDALDGRVVRYFAVKALDKPPWMRFACCSIVAFVDGGLPFGSLVFHNQFLDLFV